MLAVVSTQTIQYCAMNMSKESPGSESNCNYYEEKRLLECLLEHTPSEINPEESMSNDMYSWLQGIRIGKRLPYLEHIAALVLVDTCERCPNYQLNCFKKRRGKVGELQRYLAKYQYLE